MDLEVQVIKGDAGLTLPVEVEEQEPGRAGVPSGARADRRCRWVARVAPYIGSGSQGLSAALPAGQCGAR